MKRTALILLIACLMVATAGFGESGAAAAGPSYGDQTTIDYFSPVPDGWVVIDSDYPDAKRIMYIVGAPYGVSISVTQNSPIPDGWVITDFGDYSDYQRIMNVNGAPYGTTITVYFFSPIPSGWVVIDSSYPDAKRIRYLGG